MQFKDLKIGDLFRYNVFGDSLMRKIDEDCARNVENGCHACYAPQWSGVTLATHGTYFRITQ